MTRLETHVAKAHRFAEGATEASSPEVQVEAWFLSAYHFIEACAAQHRLHIQKHQRIGRELQLNPTIFGERTEEIRKAFLYLDNEARAKFVYGGSGTEEDLQRARESYKTIRSICEEVLR